MNNFIYEKKSLTYEICDKIISLFETQKELQNVDVVGSDANDVKYIIDKTTKNTTDIEIPLELGENDIFWDISTILKKEISNHLPIFYEKFNDIRFYTLTFKNISISNFLIQKYKINEGGVKYHNDFYVNFAAKKSRIITFMWYLNDIEEGGETEFFGYHKIKPKKGNIVLFPSEWFISHCANCPISNDKYIVTGCIYIDI